MLSISPKEGATSVPIDSLVEINFNQSMDPASVQESFSLLAPGGIAVEGTFGWNAGFSTLVFTPTNLLTRETAYSLILQGQPNRMAAPP